MGIKEDFAAFATLMNTKMTEVSGSLQEIQNDISALMNANASTPQEVIDGMAAISARLSGIADAAKTAASLYPGGTPQPPSTEAPL